MSQTLSKNFLVVSNHCFHRGPMKVNHAKSRDNRELGGTTSVIGGFP